MNDDTYMKQLLTLMCLVDWLADDLHYKSSGPGFYEKHLLADRVRDLGDDDGLKEGYWLGFKGVQPPLDQEIAQMTLAAYGKISAKDGDLVKPLVQAFDLVVQVVEQCKAEQDLPGGVHQMLDDISNKALTNKFLVKAEAGM